MSAKLSRVLTFQAAKLVQAGWLIKDAAVTIGTTPGTLGARLKELGLSTGRRPPRPAAHATIDENLVLTDYAAGTGVMGIAQRYDVKPRFVTDTLKRHGVHLRSLTGNNRAQAALRTPDERKRYIRSARSVRYQHMLEAAQQGTKNPAVPLVEHSLAECLKAAGLPVQQQVVVDGYYIDIVVDHVAVEVEATQTISATVVSHERFKKLSERGFSLIFAEIRGTEALRRHTQQVVTYIKQARRLPPFGRQYWVIRCRLYDLASDIEANEFSLIKCAPYTNDPVT